VNSTAVEHSVNFFVSSHCGSFTGRRTQVNLLVIAQSESGFHSQRVLVLATKVNLGISPKLHRQSCLLTNVLLNSVTIQVTNNAITQLETVNITEFIFVYYLCFFLLLTIFYVKKFNVNNIVIQSIQQIDIINKTAKLSACFYASFRCALFSSPIMGLHKFMFVGRCLLFIIV
jgi:hypothetical protein